MNHARHIEHCPSCGATMEQLDSNKEAVWTINELAADLARCSVDDGAWLIWYSKCPKNCHQCFRCLEWFPQAITCPHCPACPECGGPLMTWLDEDDDDYETEMLGCARCSDEADEATHSAPN